MLRFRRDAARFSQIALAVVGLGACSDPSVGSLTSPVSSAPRFLVTPTPAQVVVPIGDAGQFANSIAADNSGRATTEFWDNISADNKAGVTTCNIGYYATGTFGTKCLNEAGMPVASDLQGTSDANQGGYSKYFGDGGGFRDAAGFMFNGDFTYTVKLLGSYAGENSRMGYFTKVGGSYQLYPVASWGNRVVNSTMTIDTDGADWGFYIANDFNAENGGCTADLTHCSDATGGFTAIPYQHFALMLGNTAGTYMVGVEDNKLETLPRTDGQAFLRDSDYNDFILSVTVDAVPDVAVCDFVTFGRMVTEMNGQKVVISGNTGGNQPGGGILNEFHIDIDGTDYHVANIDSYGPITSGPLSGLTNSRISIGTAKNGKLVELRVWDGGEPGSGTDMVYVKIDGVVRLAPQGQFIDQGNMQYHATCRGPK